MRRFGWIVAALLLAVGGCDQKSDEEQWTEVAKSLPWMVQVLEYCEAYKSTKSDNDKGTLYRETNNFLTTVRADSVRATVDKLIPMPKDAPAEYVLQVALEEKVRFASQSGERSIAKGSTVFEQVAALKEGQCVTFSAHRVAPMAGFQMGKVCDPRYYAEFLDVRPCE